MKIFKLGQKRQADFVRLSQQAYGISTERARALSQLADNMLLVGKANEKLNEIYAEWEGRAKRAYLDLGLTKGTQKNVELAVLNGELNIAGIDAEAGIVIQRTDEDKDTSFEALKAKYLAELAAVDKGEAVLEDSTEPEGDTEADYRPVNDGYDVSVLSETD